MPKGEAPLKEPHCHQLDLQLPVLRIKENRDFPFRNHQPEGLHYDSKLVHPTCPYYPSRVSVSTSTQWECLTCPAHGFAVWGVGEVIQREVDGPKLAEPVDCLALPLVCSILWSQIRS